MLEKFFVITYGDLIIWIIWIQSIRNLLKPVDVDYTNRNERLSTSTRVKG